MKKLPWFALILSAALAAPAFAADAAKAPTAQQQRMKDCNAQAKTQGVKGDERKKFMSACLKGESAAAPEKKLTPQQEKMKSCNATATAQGLKADARKKFMSDCLKGG